MTRDPPKFNMQDAAWIPDEELAGKVFMIHGKRKWPGKFYGISNCKAIPTIAPKRLLPKNLPVCSRSQTFSLADMEPFLIWGGQQPNHPRKWHDVACLWDDLRPHHPHPALI